MKPETVEHHKADAVKLLVLRLGFQKHLCYEIEGRKLIVEFGVEGSEVGGSAPRVVVGFRV